MSKGNDNNPIENEHVREHLSDYMDGLLPGDMHETVRAHIEVCVDCRADYAELRATQKLLQTMPAMAAPRSFTLTPEMAGQGRKASLWERLFAPRNAPRLATGSLVAFLLLFLFVVGDFQGSRGNATVTATLKSGPSASGADAQQQPSAPPDNAFIATAPTSTTADSAPNALGSGSGGVSGAAAPTDTAGVSAPSDALPPAPTTATSAGQDTPTENRDGITPNTEVGNTGTSSPTTTTLDIAPEPPSGDGTISTDKLYTSSAPSAENPAPTSAAPGDNHTGWVALQLGLLTLGLALGVSAYISSRRT
jgi:anti-sigma factor RsiW